MYAAQPMDPSVMTAFVLPLLIGIIAGLRAMTAPAAVSWAARLGWLDLAPTAGLPRLRLHAVDLDGARPRRAGHRPAADDAEPHGADPVRRAHRRPAALSGAAIGAARRRRWSPALVAGVVGAVIGTLGGRAVARQLAAAFGSDRPAALIEDAVAIVGALADRAEHRRDQHFDAIIIGAGQAGPPLAGRLTAAGMTVALVERKLFGGTCVNTGCMPTKTLVASAYAAHLARRGGRLRRRARAAPPRST